MAGFAAVAAMAVAAGGCEFESARDEQPPESPAETSGEAPGQGAEDPDSRIAPIAPLSIERVELGDGSKIDYVAVLPKSYTREKTYPIVVALPPGDQSAALAENVAASLYLREARERGWIVLSPIAPRGRLFFDGVQKRIPQLLFALADRYQPEGDKYHLVGLSNGGISAFRLAIDQPGLFHSLLAFPGFPREAGDLARLGRLREIPIRMIAGQHDVGWVEPMRDADRRLRRLGADVTLQVEPGEEHILGTVDGRRIFDILEPLRPPPESGEEPVVAS
ncbi:MAG: hypothetical protein OEM67_02895 [Thermoleophilia bacterium]|nr:hypothetical protein [Thermoleophilia bacterium]